MFEQYQGLSSAGNDIYAMFALSDAVKKGFNLYAAGVSESPDYLAVNLQFLKLSYDQQKAFLFPELGIVMNESSLSQILQVAKDRVTQRKGVGTLPLVQSDRSIILGIK